jgi:hypothetical protein
VIKSGWFSNLLKASGWFDAQLGGASQFDSDLTEAATGGVNASSNQALVVGGAVARTPTVQAAIAAASNLPLTLSGVSSAIVLVQAQSTQPLVFGGVVTGVIGNTVNADTLQSIGLGGFAQATVGDSVQSGRALGLAG